MNWQYARRAWIFAVGLGLGLFMARTAAATDPAAGPLPLPPVQKKKANTADPADGPLPPVQQTKLVQPPVQPPPPAVQPPPPSPQPPPPAPVPSPTAPSPTAPAPAAVPSPGRDGPAATGLGVGSAPQGSATPAPVAPAGNPTTSVPVATQQAAQTLNASDLGQVLNRSVNSTGVINQQRNALVTDPRIRGLQSYRYLSFGDGGQFVPARLDLDTPITRFDPSIVQDVKLVKGPYSAFYGPGLAVLDVTTLGAPTEYTNFQVHGRTGLTYQTNGQRYNGLQSFWGGDRLWGFRVTYNGLTGNDYQSGNGGPTIASSYLSHNVNWALRFDPTDKSRLEIKGIRGYQQNVEYPGLYFDIGKLNTEAYNLHYELRDQGAFDRFVTDAWYNNTTGTGTTQGGAKQAFVQDLLAVSFNPGGFNQQAFNQFGGFPILTLPQAILANNAARALNPAVAPLNTFRDYSTSDFATSSLGYRLFTEWGKPAAGESWMRVGTDMRILGQQLHENIQFAQLTGTGLNNGLPVGPGNFPTFFQQQGIPGSNSVNPGIFLADELVLNSRATVRSGGRMDWVRTSTAEPRVIAGNVNLFGPPGPQVTPIVNPLQFSVNPADPNTTRNFYLLSGYLQGQYKLTDAITGQVSVGHSERAPTLTELYATGPFVGVLQQGTSRLIGDPHLAPERLTQMDVGLLADYGFFRGGASAFYGWINNYITFDRLNAGPGLTQVVFTNTNLATIAGAEMFGQLDVTDWLTTFGAMTFVQGVDQTHVDTRRNPTLASSRRTDPVTGAFATATEPLPQIPPLDTRLGIQVHEASPQRRWQVEFSARIVNGQNAIARSLGEIATPGFTVFNIRGYWQATEQLLLTAGVENFGNKLYREHLDPISGNILGVNPLFRPGTNFYFGTQVTY